ncbi:MAG: hypothetical protein JWO94_2711, partial [Verrucomicrobiaceae bacterium]|nr:hypothetical protein [Verrucomicrobiaceae bacterium]
LAAIASLVMVYPRYSLIQALTFVKIIGESFHEAFNDQPLKKKNAPGVGQNDRPGAPPAGKGGDKGSQGESLRPAAATATRTVAQGKRQPSGQSTGSGPAATGQPLTINTPAGDLQPGAPKFSVNLVIPGGNAGSGSSPPAEIPPQQGPAPSAIIINNPGGAEEVTSSLPPVTITQAGAGHQPPPSAIIVNGPALQPPSVMIQEWRGRGQAVVSGQRSLLGSQATASAITEPEGEGMSGESGGSPTGTLGATARLHHGAAGLLALPPDWPRTVALTSTPIVTMLERGSGAGRQFAVQTDHYEFQSDSQIGADVVREMARVFEATYELNNLLPLRLHPMPEKGRPRFIAKLFSKDHDYFAAGGMQGSTGTYSRDQACILVPISSMGVKMVNGRMQTERTESTETLIHEITHQMMNTWLPLIPRWYAEGSADYIAMVDYVHGRFFLNQIEDRLRRYLRRRGQRSDTFAMLRPAELMALDAKSWGMAVASNADGASQNYASATLLTFYFYHLDGNGDGTGMRKYLRAVEQGTPEPEASAAHLLRGRSMATLESDVTDAFERRGIKIATIARGRLAKE